MNLPLIDKYLLSSSLDISLTSYLFWKPTVYYQNMVSSSVLSNQIYVGPDGTYDFSFNFLRVDWTRRVSITVQCNFDFALFPNDY